MEQLNNCGCCEGLSLETPVKVYNRPRLSAISYRVGNHPKFKESLLASLSISRLKAFKELTGIEESALAGKSVPSLSALKNLTSRNDDDFSIALLDAWAVVSDVLTFYQERIANESYLGTATEDLSILELARLIGYELRPGVAASTYFAFTIDENSLAKGQALVSGINRGKEEVKTVLIQSGTKVMSIPEQDEDPQNFETIENIEARAEWNAMMAIQNQSQISFIDSSDLIVIDGTSANLKVGDILIFENSANPFLKKVLKIEEDAEADQTWIYLSLEDTVVPPTYTKPAEYLPDGSLEDFDTHDILSKDVLQILLNKTWTEEDLSLILKTKDWSVAELEESLEKYFEDQKITNNAVFVFRTRTAAFGYNALKQVTYNSATGIPHLPSAWQEWKLESDEGNEAIFLDGIYEKVTEDSYVAIQKNTLANAKIHKITDVIHSSRSAYGMSSKSTKINVDGASWLNLPDTKAIDQQELSLIRPCSFLVESESLDLTEVPILDVVSGNTIHLSNFQLGLKKGQQVILFGERADLPGAHFNELGKINAVFIYKGRTVIELENDLTYSYIRKTFRINANVALATHGETVSEIVGNGNASHSFQKFVLKQTPLTFISAATPSGTASSLTVRVNNILWEEVSSLYDHGPEEHIFTTQQDDLGNTTIIFGDGKTGARLPTGQANISTSYRIGIGVGGLLKPHQLSQLISKPLGVKEVTNPLASDGAQDREEMADAKRNAKLTIYTLGRIVSLQDYEDYCRAFAGIAKAQATWIWCNNKQCVFLTIAGYQGASISEDSSLYDNLLTSIREFGLPDVEIRAVSYLPRFFKLAAKIIKHPDYISEKVISAVEDALREEFSFDQRNFGQPVSFSEIVAIMQNVEGVVAVDVDQFYRSDLGVSKDIPDRIIAGGPRAKRNDFTPSELLILDPSPIELTLTTS